MMVHSSPAKQIYGHLVILLGSEVSTLFTFSYARLKNGRIMLWQCPSVLVVTRQKLHINGSVVLGADESPWPCGTPIWYTPFSWMILSKQKNLHLFSSQYICVFSKTSVHPSVRLRFPNFFQNALRYQFETWYMYIHSVGGTTCRVWVSSQLGHFDPVYSQK